MKIAKEFKEFIMRGNVFDLAVGVVIGTAFSAIVTSIVNDIFMPVIGLITGGINIETLSVTFGSGENAAVLKYGAFLNSVITFFIIALFLFLLVKGINRMRNLHAKKEEAIAEEEKRLCPFCKMEIHKEATRCPHCTGELAQKD